MLNNQVSITAAIRIAGRIIKSGDARKWRPYFEGVPGVAKTSIINQIAAIYGFDVITVMLSQMTRDNGHAFADDARAYNGLPISRR
jgi:midasin (ATPase involved in ribosome maturation)